MNLLKYLFFIILYLFVFPTSAFAAKLSLEPTEKTVTSGEQFTVNFSLDTEGKTINSADVALNYPQNLLWIDKVDYPTVFPFHVQSVTKREGKVIFHFGADSQGTRFAGRGLLASLTLSTHAAGEAYLSFVCDNSNDNDDSNIWEAETGEDIVDCGLLDKGVYHINPKVGGITPSPSPVCLRPQPPTGLEAKSGPATGQATLSWQERENTDYYSLTYGLASGGYIYGAPNIGKGTEYIVSQLASGRGYFFVLTAVNSCGSSGYSAEASARAGGSLPAPSSVPEAKGGWQPGEVITFSPTPLFSPLPEEATPAATPSPEESPTPAAFIPPKEEPFWRQWNFWLKAGGLSLILFALLLILSTLIKRLRARPSPEAEEKPVSSLSS